MGEKWCSGAGAGRCAGDGDRLSVAGAVRLGGIRRQLPIFHVLIKSPFCCSRCSCSRSISQCLCRVTVEPPHHHSPCHRSAAAACCSPPHQRDCNGCPNIAGTTVACSWQQAALTMRHRVASNCQNSLFSCSLVRNVTAPRCSSCVNDELSLRL